MITLGFVGCGDVGTGNPAPARPGGKDDGPATAFEPAPHPPFPQLPANQGIVLAQPRLVTLVSAGDPLADRIFAYGDALIASGWWTSVSGEYGIGPLAANLHVTGPAITQELSLAQLEQYVQQAIAMHPQAQPDGRTIYALYLPRGTTCGTEAHHYRFGMKGDALAVTPRCQDTLAALAIQSHEIIEAATDPPPSQGYHLPSSHTQPWTCDVWAATSGEVGDLCEGAGTYAEGGFLYQHSWSNVAAAAGLDPCAPAPATPAFGASPEKGWYPVASGGTLEVPVLGWSNVAMADWNVAATVALWQGTGSGFAAALDVTTLGNGKRATLSVTAPAAPSGTWALIRLVSTTPGDPATRLLWPVGFYVP